MKKANNTSFCIAVLLSLAGMLQGQSIRSIEYFNFESGVYLPAEQMVYATAVDGALNKYSNKLLKIDPAWGAVREEINVGFDPRFLCATSDRQYLFFSADQPRRIKRFNPAIQAIDQDFAAPLSGETQLKDLYSIPKKQEAVMLLTQSPETYEFSILERGQSLPQTAKLSLNEGSELSLGFQNDSTLWVISTFEGNIIRLKIRTNGIVREQTYSGFKGILSGSFYFSGQHFISTTGLYISLGINGPQLEDRLAISHSSAIAGEADSSFFYVLEPFGFSATQIRKFSKHDFQELDKWQIPVYPNYFNSKKFLICGDRRFVFTTFNVEFYWDCVPQISKPVIVGKPDGVYCLPQDLGYVLKTQEPAIELFWQRENQGGQYASELSVTESGVYRVKASDKRGCQTAFSDPLGIGLQNPSPTATILNNLNVSFPVNACTGQEIELRTSTFFQVDQFEWSNGDTSARIKVKDVGVFRVRVRPIGGCWSIWSDSVRINRVKELFPDQPIVSLVNAQSNVFCSGDTIVLQATPGYLQYFWSLPNQGTGNQLKISFNSIIDFGVSVYVANAEHCVSEYSERFQLRYIAKPTKPQIQRAGNVLVSSNADPAAIHSWYRNGVLLDNASGRYLTVLREGFYSTQVTYGACSSLPSDLFSFTGITTALSEPTPSDAYPLYPNPSTDKVFVQHRGTEFKQSQLFDAQGKALPLSNFHKGQDQYEMSLGDLAAGVYVLRSFVEGKWCSWRFVKL